MVKWREIYNMRHSINARGLLGAGSVANALMRGKAPRVEVRYMHSWRKVTDGASVRTVCSRCKVDLAETSDDFGCVP